MDYVWIWMRSIYDIEGNTAQHLNSTSATFGHFIEPQPQPHTHTQNTTAKTTILPALNHLKPNNNISRLDHFLPTPIHTHTHAPKKNKKTKHEEELTNIEPRKPPFYLFFPALHPYRETHHGHVPLCSLVTSQFSWFTASFFPAFVGC